MMLDWLFLETRETILNACVQTTVMDVAEVCTSRVQNEHVDQFISKLLFELCKRKRIPYPLGFKLLRFYTLWQVCCYVLTPPGKLSDT